MVKTKIAVLVSGGGTNLQALIDAQKEGKLGNGEIALVISSKPDVYALERAKNNGIATKVLCRKEYASIADYSKAQKLSDAVWQDKEKWNKMSLENIAGAGIFAADRAINEYAKNIWNAHSAF